MTPSELWYQAHTEHPNDDGARSQRYLTLMREHGFIRQRDPAEKPRRPLLPCGWPRSKS